MSGQPLRHPTDADKFRQQYLAYLKLRAELDDKNLQANKIYIKTGETPSQPTDQRTTSEKYADIERLKIELRSGLNAIMDGKNANETVQDARISGNPRMLVYVSQRLPELITSLKPKYRLGVPSDIFINTVERMRDADEKNAGVVGGIQSTSGANTIITQQQIQSMITPRDVANINRMMDGIRSREANEVKQIANDLFRRMDLPKAFDAIAEIEDPEDQQYAFELLNQGLKNFPTPVLIYKILDELAQAEQMRDAGMVKEILMKLILVLEQDEGSKQSLNALTQVIEASVIAKMEDTKNRERARAEMMNPREAIESGRGFEDEQNILAIQRGLIPNRNIMSVRRQAEREQQDQDESLEGFFFPPEDPDELQNRVLFGISSTNLPLQTAYAPSASSTIQKLSLEQPVEATAYEGESQVSTPEVSKIHKYIPISAFPSITKKQTFASYISELVALEQEKGLISGGKQGRTVSPQSIFTPDNLPEEARSNESGNKRWGNMSIPKPKMTLEVYQKWLIKNDDAIKSLFGKTATATAEPLISGKKGSESPEGFGIHRKKVGRGIALHTDLSQGIKSSARYVPFGKYMIHNHRLVNDIITLRRPTGSQIVELPTVKVSPKVGKVMKHILGGGHPTFEDLSALSENERQYLHKVISMSKLADRISVPTPSRDEAEKDSNQFEIMKGEIMSGNDSPELIKKFKALLIKMMDKGHLPKSQAKEILYELVSLGY